jgi:hypothetical protein
MTNGPEFGRLCQIPARLLNFTFRINQVPAHRLVETKRVMAPAPSGCRFIAAG